MLIRRRVQQFRDPRLIGAAVLLTAFVAIALFVPNLDPEQIRGWARAAGPWLPLMFFVAHALITVALPRIPFTLSAGLLFGPVAGIAIAISATTVSAAVGVVPGTIAVVVLGDALLAGRTDPALVVVTAIGVAIGLAGLLVDARLGIKEPDAKEPVGSSSQV